MKVSTPSANVLKNRLVPKQLVSFEHLLLAVLILEILIFRHTGTGFFSTANMFEVLRLSTEIGLLASVMTPIILTGGIDLSVGALLGLCAILFGKLWRDAHLTPALAALITLLIGGAGGGMNSILITRLKLPPLIVTLGSFSLFRGLAEAITRGVDNFTNFPKSVLYLGQGYFLGFIPAQLPLLIIGSALIWLLVHKTTFGRSFRAIGFAPEGARYAGISVNRHLAIAYILAGFTSALAALIYVARVGQAKADAGTGYELLAITAVVLGGSSIFGGTGSVHGTLLGVAILAILRNGLTLSDQPSELAGILTGCLLLLVLTGQVMLKKISARRRRASSATV
jgi:ribose/xylose/arabinose/galactoside ABC-type transport system permease subunit